MRNAPTPAERKLWQALRGSALDGAKFSRQIVIGPFIADFVCRTRKLIVEVDGGQHSSEVDAGRTAYLEGAGYRVVRFWNREVMVNLEGVLRTIAAALADCPPPAPPVPGGESPPPAPPVPGGEK
ncbi:MAG: endonuclease domain-containing protein [Sphingomonadaceae bacterium]|nr:endonuclease domain-containing protein [Sphingomonadaceae bacterium]